MAFVDQTPNRLGHYSRVGAHRAGGDREIRRGKGRLPSSRPFEQASGIHHFADVEARAIAAAQTTEGAIGNTGHRREHDGQVDCQGADGEESAARTFHASEAR